MARAFSQCFPEFNTEETEKSHREHRESYEEGGGYRTEREGLISLWFSVLALRPLYCALGPLLLKAIEIFAKRFWLRLCRAVRCCDSFCDVASVMPLYGSVSIPYRSRAGSV